MKCAIVRSKTKVEKVEEDINTWLANNPHLKVKFITQCLVSPSTLYTTIFHEE